jgi:hypothetical protein
MKPLDLTIYVSYLYFSSIDNPAALETLTFNLSVNDDLTISVPAAQNTTANISYTCTVSPLPSSTSKKNGAGGTRDVLTAQLMGSAMLLALVASAFPFY